MRLRIALLSSVCWLPLAASAALAQNVGVTAAVNQAARGTPPRQAVRTITIGDNIIHDERIETDRAGLLQILLADGTAFTVGPNSTLTIDSFVYDPQAGTAKVAASLGKGVFRFIGGRTSKTPGGVALATPVGTVGIRGAVADIDLVGRGDIPPHIDLIFGDQIVLFQDGQQQARIYHPGYSIVIDAKGVHIVKTPPGWTSGIQRDLAGSPGSHGGAPKPPTNETVVASAVSDANSGVPFTVNAPPVPTPRPPHEEDRVVTFAGNDTSRQEARNVETPPSDNGSGGEPNPPPPPGPSSVPLRVLTALDSGRGAAGIVGGSAETDQNATLSVPAGSTEGTGQLQQGQVTLPVYSDASFTPHEVSGAPSPFGPLSGTAYGGPEGFTAYLLHANDDVAQPFYAVTGTPTADVVGVFAGEGVRHYSLTSDPIRNLSVPFMAADTGIDLSGAGPSDLLVTEGDVASGRAKVFQSWLAIKDTRNSDGEIVDQQSAIGVNVGEVAGDGSSFKLDRRGSYRDTIGGTSFYLFGEAFPVAGPAGNTFFGSNGENFLVGGDTTGAAGSFYDDAGDGSSGNVGDCSLRADCFSTIHVGNLTGTDASPARTFSGTYNGFSAGIVDAAFGFESSGGAWPVGATQMLSTDPGDTLVTFDPGTRSIGGSIAVQSVDDSSVSNLTVGFGEDAGNASESGSSAYIDDDVFGAAANRDPAKTTARIYATDLQAAAGTDPGTYFVSAQSVPNVRDMTFMSSVNAEPNSDFRAQYRCENCGFLKWGWWGTDAKLRSTDGLGYVGQASVHLGTWVAGEISNQENLAPLAGMEATYKGLAVGSVVSGGATYLAAGKMDMTFDFGFRRGTLGISDFDGRSFSGSVNGIDTSTGPSTFSGNLYGGTVSASASGAFVNNPAAAVTPAAGGVIGNFGARETSGGDWSAVGIFAGGRTGLGPGGSL